MGDLAAPETSFLHCLNGIISLSKNEYIYSEMSFPLCSNNSIESSDEEPDVNDHNAPSETNSSYPPTLDSALEIVLDSHQNYEADLVFLNQHADKIPLSSVLTPPPSDEADVIYDSTDRETSFNQCLNDISGLSDDEYMYGEMSFPQCSDNINDLSYDELVVNEPSTPSETNSSYPITFDGVLEWVLDCYQNSEAYPGLVLLNQLADKSVCQIMLARLPSMLNQQLPQWKMAGTLTMMIVWMVQKH